jgi:hypothetical protein
MPVMVALVVSAPDNLLTAMHNHRKIAAGHGHPFEHGFEHRHYGEAGNHLWSASLVQQIELVLLCTYPQSVEDDVFPCVDEGFGFGDFTNQ